VIGEPAGGSLVALGSPGARWVPRDSALPAHQFAFIDQHRFFCAARKRRLAGSNCTRVVVTHHPIVADGASGLQTKVGVQLGPAGGGAMIVLCGGGNAPETAVHRADILPDRRWLRRNW